MKLLYLATADARGHLMRAQLLVRALQAQGTEVQLVTTSDAGVAFFASFGIDAVLLSRHYAVQFDEHQNMLRDATDANVARYVFTPSRMLRDVARLGRMARSADLVVNDSFHPALLAMGCLPLWRRKIVHVYGASLRAALESNFEGRRRRWAAALFKAGIAFQINAARARLEHDFGYREVTRVGEQCYRLPTPVAIAVPQLTSWTSRNAAVYLNPHFCDPALASSLEQGLADAGLDLHAVGEGYAGRPGWIARDPRWIDHAAASDIIVSAPGMAALSVAVVYRRPILLIVTDQPEQLRNVAQAKELGLPHAVVSWHGNGPAFRAAVQEACAHLCARTGAQAATEGARCAHLRLQAWVGVLTKLGHRQADREAASAIV